VVKVNGSSGEFKKYRQRSERASTPASTQGTNAYRRALARLQALVKGDAYHEDRKDHEASGHYRGICSPRDSPLLRPSEIDPDHFDSPNTEPLPQPKTKEGNPAEARRVRFDGKVTLPYSLMCAGRKLLRGRYTVSLRSDGKTGRATLNQKGKTLEIAGAVRLLSHPHASNILLVECVGKAHTLSAIHVNEMELLFDSDPRADQTSTLKPARIEKLPLLRTVSRK
jgi:hypothetical protein